MKNILFALLLSAIATPLFAQQNILAPSGIQLLNANQWQEHRGSHYFLARQSKSIWGFNGRGPASRFEITKMKVSNNTITASRYVYGDTVQVDTFIHPFAGQAMLVSDGRIHLVYNKAILIDSTSIPLTGLYQLCYQALDTNLNLIIPETILNSESSLDTTFLKDAGVLFLSKVQNNLLLINARANLNVGSFLTEYRLLDNSANVVRRDTFNKHALGTSPFVNSVATAVVPYGQTNYLVAGEGLQHPLRRILLLTDTNLATVDSFYYNNTQGLTTLLSGGVEGYYIAAPKLTVLPNGSLVVGGMFAYSNAPPPGMPYITSLLALLRPSDGFVMSNTLVLGHKDSTDFFHANAPGPSTLAYQPADNRVYYYEHTHADPGPPYTEYCDGSDNYLQITCADTALNLRWRKFIYSGANTCNISTRLVACDGRPGVIIVGSAYSTTAPSNMGLQRDFAYHIDSSGTLSVIKSAAHSPEIRNRIALYPNPAHDQFTVDDVFGALTSLDLYDARGSLVRRETLSGRRATIPVSDLPPGLYLARVKTKDGEVVTLRVVKE